ncbi:hypothetical protein [Actinotalea subterranea]|uniref:hypothetical protein n=1 Tax=Actinotalea subterranea TaxID=2607497 RepID=UPI001FE8100A|nr:hypothetical protein [Actinotalea subterranea]
MSGAEVFGVPLSGVLGRVGRLGPARGALLGPDPGSRGGRGAAVPDAGAGRSDGRTHRRLPARGRPRVPEVDVATRLTAVAAAMRSGAPAPIAWQRGMGVPARDGVPHWADLVDVTRVDRSTARAVAAAARLAQATGAPPAPVLDAMAVALARDAEAAGQRRAALAGPAATARLLGVLPVLGVLLGVALGADPLAVLLDGGGGSGLLGAGLLLMAVGRRWTARYLRAAVAQAEGP